MINAIRFTEELEKAGFTSEQAKKSVDTWMNLINDNFATKSDFREFQLVNKSDLRELQLIQENQIKQMRSDLEGQIKDLRSELKQMSSRIVIQLGAVIVATATIATTIISLVIMR
jgi:hypothetical protein